MPTPIYVLTWVNVRQTSPIEMEDVLVSALGFSSLERAKGHVAGFCEDTGKDPRELEWVRSAKYQAPNCGAWTAQAGAMLFVIREMDEQADAR